MFYVLTDLRLAFYMERMHGTDCGETYQVTCGDIASQCILSRDVKCGSDAIITCVPHTYAIIVEFWSKQNVARLKDSLNCFSNSRLLSRMEVWRKHWVITFDIYLLCLIWVEGKYLLEKWRKNPFWLPLQIFCVTFRMPTSSNLFRWLMSVEEPVDWKTNWSAICLFRDINEFLYFNWNIILQFS